MGWHEPGRDRDPWGDSQKNPPDLDDWFRRAWQRLRARFQRSPRPPGNSRPRLWWAVPIILIGIWLLTGFYRVADSHRAVTLRFGAYAGVSGPGLHWHWPWPIGTQQTVNLSIDRSISRHAQVLARNGKLATLRLTVSYRISDPRDYLFGSMQPDTLIGALADAALARAAREQSLDALRTNNTDKLEQQLKEQIAAGVAAAETGINIESVDIGHIELPAQVRDKTQQLAQLLESNQAALQQAHERAEDQVLEAGRNASAIVAKAQQQAKAREALARIRRAHFKALLPAWQKAPTTTRQMLRADVLYGTLAELPKVVVSGSVHSVTLPPVATSAQTAKPETQGHGAMSEKASADRTNASKSGVAKSAQAGNGA